MVNDRFMAASVHPGGVVWLVGLSASGKTTLALALKSLNPQLVVLDGDVLRQGLCQDLGFSLKDRAENMRRTRELARLFAQHGRWVIIAMISPIHSDRLANRSRLEGLPFLEVFVDCPLEVCIARDPKGLYAKAIQGDLPQFTGISSLFEPPVAADLVLETDTLSASQGAALIAEALINRGWWVTGADPLTPS